MITTFDPAPTRLEEVLKPEWLTAMLAPHWPGARVRDVKIVETIVTQATKVRLALDIDGSAEAPRHICIKGILSPADVPSTASVVETLFYRDCAATQPVRVPECLHAQLNEAGDNGVIVMRDLIVGGATFLTALSPFTPDEVRATLDQLAALHVAASEGSAIYESPWAPRFLDMISRKPIIPEAALQDLLDGPRGAALPERVRRAATLQQGLEALAAQVRAVPNCLIHGDAHAGNVFRTNEGFGLVDWQVLQKGEWAQDVAYHIAAVLTPEDRRLHERDLLDHYLARIAELGCRKIEPDQAWQRYRAGMVYGYYLWAITRKVDPVITNEFIQRLGLAVDDLDSFAAAARVI